MKLRFLTITMALLGILTFSVAPALPGYAATKDDFFGGCKSGVNCSGAKTNTNLKTSAWNLVRTALIVLGGLAVIVIIIGGIMFASSAGDAGRVKAARNTIMYAVVGLIVAMFATAIITLVVNYFG